MIWRSHLFGWWVALGVLCASHVASADLANNEALHEHVDSVVSQLDVVAMDRDRQRSLLADRWSLTLGTLIPMFGTWRLDQKMFGGIRPSAIVFDWILGGAVPLGLGITALASGTAVSPRTRSLLGWTAIGLYASTRIGVLIVANLHVSEYNRYLTLRLGIAESPGGRLAPAILASASW